MKKIFYTSFLCLLTITCFSQEYLELKQFGFSLQKPKDWHESGEASCLENTKKYDWDDKQWESIKKSHKGAINVVSFHKYEANQYSGIIPTINLTISSNPTKSQEQFKQMVTNGQAQFKTMFDHFKITEALKEITIDGKKALICSSSYVIKGQNGPIKLNLKMLYIAKGLSYYTLNFIEEEGKEDNTAVFRTLVNTIKLIDVPAKK